MISITVLKHSDSYRGICISGHAEYADEGKDIVCAAVSALSINLANSIDTLTEDEIEVTQEDGLLIINFAEDLSEQGRLLTDSFILGIQNIICSLEDADETFLQLEIKEV